MKFYASSQIGIGKRENEDRMILGQSVIAGGSFVTNIESGIIAVADGVGGNKAGAVASHFVATQLSSMACIDIDQLSKINAELLALSYTRPNYCKMATTLSGIGFGKDKTVIFHIGNTRIYLLRSGKYLKLITDDDTTVNYLIRIGKLSPNEAEHFSKKNEITACFGGGDSNLFKPKLDIVVIDSPVIITSDGIHDYVNADELEDIIGKYDISLQACEKIIEVARLKGSVDDVSVIMGISSKQSQNTIIHNK